MPSLVSHQLSIIKYVVLKKIIFFFLCFDRLIWTWTWLGLEPLWTRARLGLEPLWTRARLRLEPLWTWTCLGLDKGGLDYSPRHNTAYTAEEQHAWVPSTKEASPKAQAQKSPPRVCQGHADKDEDYWDSILWSDETKINVFGTDGFKTVWHRKGEEYKEKCMVPTVKHGGGSVLMWGCMSAAGVGGELHFIDGIMNSQMYCSILKEKMLPSLRDTHLRPLLDFWRRTGWKWFSGQVCLLIWTQSNTYSEETSWALLSIQHPISKRGHSWRMEKDRSGKMSPICSFHA